MWNYFHIKTDTDHTIRYAIGVKEDELNLDKINRFIVFFNGRTQWIELNSKILDDLDISEDTAILTMDHRGQGDSGGKRASIDSYSTFVKDSKFLIDKIIGGKPYMIMSHSMGGLITLYGCISKVFTPKSLILVSPLIRLPKYRVVHQIVRVLYPLRHLGVSRLLSNILNSVSLKYETNTLTHSYKYFNEVKHSPYPVPAPDLDWLHASMKASSFILDSRNLTQLLNIPLCMIVAEKEQVVDKKTFRFWFDKLERLKNQYRIQIRSSHQPITDNLPQSFDLPKIVDQFFTIGGAYHEILTEEDHYRNQAIKIINNWFTITEFNNCSYTKPDSLDKIG